MLVDINLGKYSLICKDADESIDSSTMVPSKDTTLKPLNDQTITSSTTKTNITTSDVESDLGTLIINDETDDEDFDKTLKPAFLQHFERNESKLVFVSYNC